MRLEEMAFSCPADSTDPVPAMGLARGEFAVVLQPHCQCWLG